MKMKKQKVYTCDPLAKFLFEKLLQNFYITPLNFTIISAITMTMIYIIAASLSKTYFLSGVKKGLFEDWNCWIWILVYNPIVLGFYYWLSTNNILPNLTNILHINAIIKDKKQNDDKVNNLLKYYQHPLIKLSPKVISLAYGILFYQSRVRLRGWTGTAFLPKISATIIGIIVMYVIIMEVNILIINLAGIRKIVQAQKLNINPWHPDKCGGLKSISEYVITVNYLVGLIWFMVFASIYQFYKENIIEQFWYMLSLIPILTLFSSTCFIWTLYAVHKKMEESKQYFLQPFSQELNKSFLNINNLINRASINELEQEQAGNLVRIIKKEMNVLLELHSSYKSIIDNYPTWPFDINSIKLWLASIIIPVSIPIISTFSKSVAEMVL
jgi:hypothetical protein